MKELQEHFLGKGEVKGREFTQLMKSDKAYLYEVKGLNEPRYEVFKRMEYPRFNTVSYPGSKSFGISAWYIMDYNKAVEKFKLLSA